MEIYAFLWFYRAEEERILVKAVALKGVELAKNQGKSGASTGWVDVVAQVTEAEKKLSRTVHSDRAKREALALVADKQDRTVALVRRMHATFHALEDLIADEEPMQDALADGAIPFASGEYLVRISKLDRDLARSLARDVAFQGAPVGAVKARYEALSRKRRLNASDYASKAFEEMCDGLLPEFVGWEGVESAEGVLPEGFRYHELYIDRSNFEIYASFLYTPKSESGLRSLKDGFSHWYLLAQYCRQVWIFTPKGNDDSVERASDLIHSLKLRNIGLAVVDVDSEIAESVIDPDAKNFKPKKLPQAWLVDIGFHELKKG